MVPTRAYAPLPLLHALATLSLHTRGIVQRGLVEAWSRLDARYRYTNVAL